MPTVTVVTSGAAKADTLSDEDYHDIYIELRKKMSLRRFAEFIHSAYSFGWWGKYEAGKATLGRRERMELRRAVGPLPELPLAVDEALAGVDPDATVWEVRGQESGGRGQADRVMLVGAEVVEPITLRLNGDLQVGEDMLPRGHVVTGVTAPVRRRARKTVHFSEGVYLRMNAARLRAGLSWDEWGAEKAGE